MNVLECSADPLEQVDDESAEGSLRARALQGPTRLSSSMLFEVNRECYAGLGPKAYVDSIVPHYVSNSAFVAKAYATVVLEFLHDWFRDDNPDAVAGEPAVHR